MRLRFFPAIAMFLVAAAGTRAAPPPASPVPEALASHRMFHTVLADALRAGSLDIQLEKTRLSALQKIYSGLQLHHRGDAGNSESWACFTVLSRVGDMRIWASSSELNGGDLIDAVMLERIDTSPDCALAGVARDLPSLNDGVAIGATRPDVLSRLGQPSAAVGGVLYYGFDAPVAGAKNHCETTGGVTVGFLAHRADRIWASRTTAC